MLHYARALMRQAGPKDHTVNITPASLYKLASTSTITTDSATANVSFGVGPFTYAWTWDDNPGGFTIVSPTSATTTFRKTGAIAGEPFTGNARCTVTDTGNGNLTKSDAIDVTIERSV